HVQSGEQRCYAMTFIIVGLPGRNAECQRQDWLRAIQRLDLALSSTLSTTACSGGVYIYIYDDVPHLLDKLRIFREHEMLYPMWLQPEGMPDAHNSGLGQSCFLGHQASTPVRAVFRHRLQCLGDDLSHLGVGNRSRSARPRFIDPSSRLTRTRS